MMIFFPMVHISMSYKLSKETTHRKVWKRQRTNEDIKIDELLNLLYILKKKILDKSGPFIPVTNFLGISQSPMCTRHESEPWGFGE